MITPDPHKAAKQLNAAEESAISIEHRVYGTGAGLHRRPKPRYTEGLSHTTTRMIYVVYNRLVSEDVKQTVQY